MEPGVAAVDVGMAFLSAQHCPFGKYRQAVQRGGSGGADGGIGEDAVVECDIDAVMVPVKGYWLDGGLLRLENFRRRFHHFRHHLRRYRPRLQS